MGSGEARFDLKLEYPFSGHISGTAPKEVRHYNYRVGNIGVVTAAVQRPEAFSDLTTIPVSNRVEATKVGDALVVLN